MPAIGALVAALLVAGAAAATNPGVVEGPPPPGERITAGGAAAPAPAPPAEAVAVVVAEPSTTVSTKAPAAPAATAAAPPPARPQRPPPSPAPPAQTVAPPQPGGAQPPAAAFVPRPYECWATPPAAAWSPPGAGLYLVPVDGSPPGAPVVPGSMRPASTTFSPDGRTIAFESWLPTSDGSGKNTELYLVDRDGGNLRRIAADAYSPKHVTWSPDGRWLAFDDLDPASGEADVYLTDPSGQAIRRLTSGGWGGSRLRWSPQSDRIAFAGNWDHAGAWVLHVATGALTKAFDPATIAVSWAPDGTRLVVHVMVEGIVVVGAGGASPLLLDAKARRAEWSTTSDEIAVDVAGATLFRPDGTPFRNIGGQVYFSDWAPHGRSLAAGNQDGLYVLAHEGCPRRILTKNALSSGFAAWTPRLHGHGRGRPARLTAGRSG